MATPKPLIQQNDTIYKTLKQSLKKAQPIPNGCALDTNAIYTLQDKESQEFYLISQKNMKHFMQLIKNLENDRYFFKLEQEIYKNMPIDFDDVWCIALKEVDFQKKEPKILVKNLKKRYPYLFLNILDDFNPHSQGF